MGLRLRLTLLTAGVLAVALAAGALALAAVVGGSRTAALDDVVRERAGTVADLARGDRLPATLPVVEPGEIVQLLDADGRVLATSPRASRTLPVLPPDAVTALRAQAAGLADERPVLVRTTDHSAYDGTARVAVAPARFQDGDVTAVATLPLAEVRALTGALQVSLLGVVPVLTVLLGAVTWVVLGRALRPVEEMRAAAAGIAATGGPGSLPARGADDELGALARTLNDMLDRLREAADRQRAAADRQHRFVADAAHELRSPLAALRTTVEVAQAHPRAAGEHELAAELTPEVLRMQRLVDDLLLLARLGSTGGTAGTGSPGSTGRTASARSTGAPAARRGPVDLVGVAHDAVAGSGPAAADGAPTVTVSGGGTATGDRAALVRVVRNLVDNAARHARSEVRVRVDGPVVEVEDDGSGIPAELREQVFERFVRLDEARHRQDGGTGLGLAIAREIARDHGGDVHLGGRDDGPGLRATLRLPADVSAPDPR